MYPGRLGVVAASLKKVGYEPVPIADGLFAAKLRDR
jgi:hypothetical protein